MPRRASPGTRPNENDPLYGSKLVQQVINKVMVDGKKSRAEQIVYEALGILSQRSGQEPVAALEESVKAITPVLEVRSRRVGGATYQVPVEVRPARRVSLGMRWIVIHARSRPEKSMVERLAGEVNDAANNRGAAIKKREDTHRMAEANKAFAHYRW